LRAVLGTPESELPGAIREGLEKSLVRYAAVPKGEIDNEALLGQLKLTTLSLRDGAKQANAEAFKLVEAAREELKQEAAVIAKDREEVLKLIDQTSATPSAPATGSDSAAALSATEILKQLKVLGSSVSRS
jgi:hypothetical protein